MDMHQKIEQLLAKHANVADNISRREMIEESVARREVVVSSNGALATWTPPESTGRSPKDTYIVSDDESAPNIDWDSPNNIAMEPETFDMILTGLPVVSSPYMPAAEMPMPCCPRDIFREWNFDP